MPYCPDGPLPRRRLDVEDRRAIMPTQTGCVAGSRLVVELDTEDRHDNHRDHETTDERPPRRRQCRHSAILGGRLVEQPIQLSDRVLVEVLRDRGQT
jgi:hypothetical protein